MASMAKKWKEYWITRVNGYAIGKRLRIYKQLEGKPTLEQNTTSDEVKWSTTRATQHGTMAPTCVFQKCLGRVGPVADLYERVQHHGHILSHVRTWK
jgi:hypothetical protein